MTRKTISGADFKAFYSDPQVWDHDGKPGWYVEDFLIRVDGDQEVSMDALHSQYGDQLDKLPDDARVSIESGYLEWQGSGNPPVGLETEMRTRFDQWLESRDYVTFVATVRVPKDNRELLVRIHEGLKELGAHVTRSDEDPSASALRSAPSPPKL